MAKVFEDILSENLSDMISIGLEYADYRAEKVFIYASAENRMSYVHCFFQNRGKILNVIQLNDVMQPGEKRIDTSPDRQGDMLKILFEDFRNIRDACKDYGKEIPKEIRAVYDTRKKRFSSHLGYENVWSIRKNALPDDIMDEWMAEEQRKLDLGMSQ